MSDEFDDDAASDGPKALREAREKLAKQVKEQADLIANLQKQVRQSTLSETFKAKNVDPKFLGLYNGEDVSADAVEKWATEYGFVAPVTQEQTPAAQAVLPNVPDANTQSMQRVANASFGSQGAPAVQAGQPVPLGSVAEMEHAIRTLPMEELVRLGYMPQEAITHKY